MTIVQASFMIVTYDCQNIFIIQATDLISDIPQLQLLLWTNVITYFVILFVAKKKRFYNIETRSAWVTLTPTRPRPVLVSTRPRMTAARL